MEVCAVVMAAGDGKRMHSKHSKVVHQVAGKPIIQWVADALCEAGCTEQVYIVGEKQEEIRNVLGESVAYVFQEQRLGTGHAVMQATPFLEGRSGYTVVLPGDSPMVSAKTINEALKIASANENYAAVLITAKAPNPAGYGRIIRNSDGNVAKIVEDRDASPEEKLLLAIFGEKSREVKDNSLNITLLRSFGILSKRRLALRAFAASVPISMRFTGLVRLRNSRVPI